MFVHNCQVYMIKNYLFYIALFFCNTAFSQGEANIWYFGINAGLDFNNDPPTPLLDLNIGTMFSSEGCSSISDSNGSLLFFTNGEKVWNKNHQIMTNGDDLAGHNSATQSSAIIPCPGTYNFVQNRFDKYFLVTLDDYIDPNPGIVKNGVCFSEIDMTLDNELGAVTQNKNIALFGTTTTEKVCVVPHSNGCDYWVICKVVDSSDFYVYHISNTGFNTTPVVSTTSFFVDARPGQMKVAPNNKLLSYVVPTNSNFAGFYVFNFDNATGIITEKFADTTENENQYGTAFSPNSKVLYKSGGNRVYQYDVSTTTNADFIASKMIFSAAVSGLLSMQLGPDEKIYIARPLFNAASGGIGVINNPNELGETCNYVPDQQNLGGKSCLAGLPNQLNNLMPHNEIIIEDEDCNSLHVALENNNNIYSYSWDLFYATDPQSSISSSAEAIPLFNIPNSEEEYLVTCNVVSECYSHIYKFSFTPNNLNLITPSFDFLTNTYCENQTPLVLPLISENGITGTWFPTEINTSVTGTFPYTFTPDDNQCAYSISVDIIINPTVSVNFIDTEICSGETLNFPDTNNISGTWLPASVSNSASNTYIFTPTNDCGISTEWNVIVKQKLQVPFNNSTYCSGAKFNFPSTNGVDGTWSPAILSNSESAIYTFTPNSNCVQSTTWTVMILENFSNLNVSILNNDTVVANVDNAANSTLYQLDDGNFQTSNVFNNVASGCHTINVTDLIGCTTLSTTVLVFDYPKYFTPNGDGYNEYWNIVLENIKTNLYIFDRYGKLLKQIRQNEQGWDGIYNGKKLPATDYWFLLEYEGCGVVKNFRSHFSLVR